MKNSISRYIRYIGIGCKELKHEFDPEIHAKTYSFLEEISTTINEKPSDTLINTAVILDVSDTSETDLDTWDPISNKPSPATNIAVSLVLAYPEVYWIFIGMYYNKPQDEPHEPPWLAEHFVNPSDTPSGMQKCIDLLKRHQDGYKPIFDPSGLRTWIKRRILEKEEEKEEKERLNSEVFTKTKQIIDRRIENCSVVIEEELPFTYLNGYTAYRFGYRCYMITSANEMNEVLQDGNKNIKMSFEDLDIKLSGMSDGKVKDLRDLYKRADDHKALKNITSLDFNEEEFKQSSLTVNDLCEVIVNDNYTTDIIKEINTVDGLNKLLEIPNFFEILFSKKSNPRFSRDSMILVKKINNYRNNKSTLTEVQEKLIKRLNRLLLEENYPEQTPKYQKKRLVVTGVAKNDERRNYEDIFAIIDKPYSGIYGLKKYLSENSRLLKRELLLNKTPNQNTLQQANSSNKGNSHSAPNRILTIADFLIGRARKILDDAKSCEGYVLGAVLALEAKELLCGQSMTTALEAVSLQHQLEAKAECSFLGVAHEIEVKSRFEGIKSEVNMIIGIPEKCKSKIDKINGISEKPKSIQYAQSYNTQLEIVSNIRHIFNDYEQFDEEEQCIIKVRWLRQQLHKYQSWPRWVYSKIIEWYLNLLMSTTGYIPWNLGLASLCWILLFSVVLTCCCPIQLSVNSPDFHAGEFKRSSDLRKLYRETTKDRLGKYIHARIDSISRLNELLQVPNLYDNILQKYPDVKPLVALKTLVKETERYRNQRYSSLESDAQDTIKKLNRQFFEEKYKDITPKHDTSKIEGFSMSVFKKSARLYLLTFLELSHQEELNGKSWLFCISILEIIVAHVHLGIFISYLFQKLARR